jgi:hypothetical protein
MRGTTTRGGDWLPAMASTKLPQSQARRRPMRRRNILVILALILTLGLVPTLGANPYPHLGQEAGA